MAYGCLFMIEDEGVGEQENLYGRNIEQGFVGCKVLGQWVKNRKKTEEHGHKEWEQHATICLDG